MPTDESRPAEEETPIGEGTPVHESPSTARSDAELDLDCLDDAERPPPDEQSPARYLVRSTHEIETVWPGAPADYALITHGDYQFVAFYGERRDPDAEVKGRSGELTVGQRRLGCGSAWQFVRLGEKIRWDAHEDVTMAVDGADRLHVAGAMHDDPLTYFSTREPMDITTLERHSEMVGSEESAITYPEFVHDPRGRLVFGYRSGGSGDGVRIYDVFDPDARSWERLLDEPLIDGGGSTNAYPVGPELGPDDCYHLVWVWRDTPDASTNHDLSYARSPDLVDWERSDGTALELPITVDEAEIVDPVPVDGGTINDNTLIGFDARNRVILSYHKFDEEGNTQLYNARREADGWEIYRTTDWDYRWDVCGYGSLPFEIQFSEVGVEDGRLVQSYEHVEYGDGSWILDEETLTPVDGTDRPPNYPDRATTFDAPDDRLKLNWVEDRGDRGDEDGDCGDEDGVHYALRWPTLPANRDRAYADVPDPTTLRLYEFERTNAADGSGGS